MSAQFIGGGIPIVLAAQAPQGGGGTMMLVGYMALIFGIFYFMVIRPQKRKEKERKQLIDSVKSGDKVIFCGGMIGTVANVKEQTLVVKAADNVKVEILRGAVLRVMAANEEMKQLDAQ